MTCIVGATSDRGRLILGSDSECSDGRRSYILGEATPKIAQIRNALVGSAGSPRVWQLAFRELMDPIREGFDPWCGIGDFVEDLVRVMEEWQLTCTENCSRHMHGSTAFLVGLRGEWFEIGHDFSIVSSRDGFMAIGSGGPVALGYLEAVRKQPTDGKKVRAALKAAAYYTDGVKGPFRVLYDAN